MVNKSSTRSLFVLILVSGTLTSVLASICPENQYLNAHLQQCINCTECGQGTVVLRPCELHRDTHCGPISDLSELLVRSENHHRHHHEKHRHEKHRNREGDNGWRFGDEFRDGGGSGAPSPAALAVASSEAPFSSAEAIVWDWQAIALTSAVFACILFFLVITLYSLHQARQWRRLKENFEAVTLSPQGQKACATNVEELSARLSLMAATSTEKCEFLDGQDSGVGFVLVAANGSTGATTDPNNYLNSRCVYLEQLLSVRKEDEKNSCSKPKGNVYIEEKKSKK